MVNDTLSRRYRMSTLDEITKEKQRVSEALAHIDVQRERLTGQLGELEATERVLARYSKGQKAKKTVSAKTPTTATKAAAPARRQRGRATPAKPAGGKSAPRRPSASRSLPWQTARRRRKSRLHAGGRARTMSAASLPGTSELAASNCATASSTPRSRRRRSNAPRSDTAGNKKTSSERSPPSLPRSSPVIAADDGG